MSKCIRCRIDKTDIAYYCFKCQRDNEREKTEERRHKETIKAMKEDK